MPAHGRWFPEQVWHGHSCYVVGGGYSLHDFDWDLLADRNVVGTNVMFYYGHDLVPICVAGDARFINNATHQKAIKRYVAAGGIMVTNSNRYKKPPPWLKVMKRKLRGLGTDALGWNANTGASAINLALLLGANPVYLLGYDMQPARNGRCNFHTSYAKSRSNPKVYKRFIKGMEYVAADLKKVFPDRQVINLEDDTSALDVFPKQSLKAHFKEN